MAGLERVLCTESYSEPFHLLKLTQEVGGTKLQILGCETVCKEQEFKHPGDSSCYCCTFLQTTSTAQGLCVVWLRVRTWPRGPVLRFLWTGKSNHFPPSWLPVMMQLQIKKQPRSNAGCRQFQVKRERSCHPSAHRFPREIALAVLPLYYLVK